MITTTSLDWRLLNKRSFNHVLRLVCSRNCTMDSSKVQNSDLSTDDWNKRWEEGRTAWHKEAVNAELQKYFDRLVGNDGRKRVLFPLCGKSIDMRWVAEQGHDVIGVDGSDLAAKSFFKENGIEYKMDAINMAPRGALVFSSLDDRIKIFICNFLDFRSTVAGGKMDAAFDRGALVAVNPKDRPKYAKLMADLIAPGGKILAECFEYDSHVYGGPPHHVPENHVREIYEDGFDVVQLENEIDNHPRFKNQWNIDVMHRPIYLMTRK